MAGRMAILQVDEPVDITRERRRIREAIRELKNDIELTERRLQMKIFEIERLKAQKEALASKVLHIDEDGFGMEIEG